MCRGTLFFSANRRDMDDPHEMEKKFYNIKNQLLEVLIPGEQLPIIKAIKDPYNWTTEELRSIFLKDLMKIDILVNDEAIRLAAKERRNNGGRASLDEYILGILKRQLEANGETKFAELICDVKIILATEDEFVFN